MKIEEKINKYLVNESTTSDIENAIRDNLSDTDRKTTSDKLFLVIKQQYPKIKKNDFMKVWNSLIDDDYLVKIGSSYRWE